jgi:hypothetical protein
VEYKVIHERFSKHLFTNNDSNALYKTRASIIYSFKFSPFRSTLADAHELSAHKRDMQRPLRDKMTMFSQTSFFTARKSLSNLEACSRMTTKVGDLERFIVWTEFTRIYIPFSAHFSYTYSHRRGAFAVNDEEI